MTNNSQKQVHRGGWEELSNAVFTTNETAAISSNPESHFVRPDGTAVTVIVGTDIETYPISLPYYDPNKIGSKNDSFTFTIPDDATPIGHCWNDDGHELYVVGQATKKLLQYRVPVAYKPSSIVDAVKELSLSIIANDPLQCVLSRDGDFIFVTDGVSLYSFPLPVKDDIESNVSNTSFTPGGGVSVDSVAFKFEGDKLYLGDIATKIITEYVATLPYIIDPAPTPNGNTLTLPMIPTSLLIPNSISFRSSGAQFFVLDRTKNKFVRLHMDPYDHEWNISMVSLFSNALPVVDSQGIAWKPTGLKLFLIIPGGAARIDQHNLSKRWNTNGAVGIATFSLVGIASSPRGMDWIFEGIRCIVVDDGADSLVQLNSSGHELSGMSDPGISFSLAPATAPKGIAFTKDRLTAYVTDAGTSRIYQFAITYTGSDITSVTYTGNSLLVPSSTIEDIQLKPDDKLMYIAERTQDRILLYKLPSDGNVTNAELLDELPIGFLETNMRGFFIRENDGKQLSIVGNQSGFVSTLDMLPDFDNSIITDFGDEIVTDLGESVVYA